MATYADSHVDTHLLDIARWPDLAPIRASVQGRVETAVARRLFTAAVGRLPVSVRFPDGRVVGTGGPTMTVLDEDSFFRRLGSGKLIGFGESYMAGDWEAEDLGGFLTVLAAQMASLVPEPLQRLRALVVARHPASERNIEANTQRNIARHYDLSNDMFATFLDETMTYSSALFAEEPTTGSTARADLAEAQRRKIDRLLDQAGVGAGTRVLEIGTGWGELCIRAAERGATVTSVTLSEEQKSLAEERIAAAGHSDAVTVELKDYRAVEGEYDAVLSVEMIEAVGYEFWPTYFETIDRLLAPGGKAAIQAITMPHDRMLATRSTYTWVNKYIFPGGFLPSVEAIEQVTRDHTSLRVGDRLSMGHHYAETLRLWDQAFLAAHDRVHQLGFDSVFDRMWHFYLEYSRAGFASGYIDVNQITLQRKAEER
ncbi:class I SAM-dependent methyltransferase [Nocardioides mangrovicus]|uniref:Class I SAM-dependent methyltransferase n=1 Tax=Nocardioides mangrovicus TaxID=2478913 RepID=A0A3L8NY17_9ACTN|nr:cyclopropane-fatty-acyl-phospholipid synthase family protein [Nocardioides mangrovicus]RLV47527.1 class I SAM-dependent methyltransferase [Nocardioides mangrovicus]